MKKYCKILLISLLFFSTTVSAQSSKTENILGADISFLPQLEARGIQFSDKGKTQDAILILKEKGFNYIRLRIFVNPAEDSGYSPKKGFCDLAHTLIMARRIKAAGLKILLDFHYSDTWADPGKQFKPAAWAMLPYKDLKKAIFIHTVTVLNALKEQNTFPDMIQMGNEINHGILWPEGKNSNMDQLCGLLKSSIDGVKQVDKSVPIMIHIACGGQNKESIEFLDQIIARKVKFDIIGQSYYPQWHGTLVDLENNMKDLSTRYQQDLILVEYTAFKKEVNDIAFAIQGKNKRGTFIWEPLSTWEKIFEKDGKSNTLIELFPEISRQYLKN